LKGMRTLSYKPFTSDEVQRSSPLWEMVFIFYENIVFLLNFLFFIHYFLKKSFPVTVKKVMKAHHILFSVYLAFIFYSLAILFWGSSGLMYFDQLNKHKNLLSEDLIKVKEENRILGNELTQLKTHPEYLGLKSREMGYYEEKYHYVFIKGMSDYKFRNSFHYNNNIKFKVNPPVQTMRTLAVAVFFIMLSFMLLLKENSR